MKILFSFLVLSCLMSGCRKNDFILDYSGIKPIVIIPNANWPGISEYDLQPVDSLFGVKELKVYAKVSYAFPLEKAVKVTFVENQDMLATYNNKWGTGYKALPAAAYSISSYDVTIAAGTQQAFIPVTIYPEKFNGNDDYLIAFTISAAGEEMIASNAKTIVFTLKGQ